MSDPAFDPYYTWLGIPPEEQPANHYRLLGVRLFEANADAISNAAESRMLLVRQYQGGKHSDASQAVLNKIAAARICLLNANSKADYDAKLKAENGSGSAIHAAAPATAHAAPKPLPKAKSLDAAPAQRPAPQPNLATSAGGQFAITPHAPGQHPATGAMNPATHPGAMHPGQATNPSAAANPPWLIPAAIGGGLLVGGLILAAIMMFAFGGGEPEVVIPGPKPKPPVPGPVNPTPPMPRPPEPGPMPVPPGPGPMPKPPEPPPIVVVPPSAARPGPGPLSRLRSEREFGGISFSPRDQSSPIAGGYDEITATQGMIGVLEEMGKPQKVLLRYRIGATLSDAWARDALEAAGAGRAGPRHARLAGRFELSRQMDVRFETKSDGIDGVCSVSLNGQPIAQVVPSSPTKTEQLNLRAGVYDIVIDILGTSLGNMRLDVNEVGTGQKIDVSYNSGALDRARKPIVGSPPSAEWLLATRAISIPVAGAAIPGVPPMPTPGTVVEVPGPGPEAVDPAGEVTLGKEDDPNVTTGLLGRLMIDGVDQSVLVRWRPGRAIKTSWLDDFRKTHNLPAGMPTIAFTGKFVLPKPQVGDSMSVVARMEGGTRNSNAFARLTVDGRVWMTTGGANYSTSDSSHQYIKAGPHDVLWEISGAPMGTCTLKITDPRENTDFPIVYTTADLKTGRKHPLRTEVVLTTTNGLILKWAGGRNVSTSIQPLDPAEGPAVVGTTPLVGQTVPSETKKVAAPAATEVSAKVKEIAEEVLKKEISAAKSADEKGALSKDMVKLAREEQGDPVARFALLQLAWQAAAAAGDAQQISAVIDEIDYHFEADILAIKEQAFKRAENAAVPPEGVTDVAQAALDTVDEAVIADRFDVGQGLLDSASALATRSKDRSVMKAVGDRRQEFVAQKRQHDAVAGAQTTLKTAPDDPAANAAIGKYYAAVKGDWTVALTHLAKGADAVLSAAAKLDQAGGSDADAQAKIGDAWWDAAEKLPTEEQLPFKLRAHGWYKQALPQLGGLAKVRVEKRVSELDAAANKAAADTAAAATKGLKEKPEPGLILRIVDGSPATGLVKPTPYMAIAATGDEYTSWIGDKASAEARKGVTSINPYFVAQGYVYLTSPQIVMLECQYCAVQLGNNPPVASSYSLRRIPAQLPKGLHVIRIVAGDRYSVKFSVIDARGNNVLFHLPTELKKELGQNVPFNGQQVKSILLRNE